MLNTIVLAAGTPKHVRDVYLAVSGNFPSVHYCNRCKIIWPTLLCKTCSVRPVNTKHCLFMPTIYCTSIYILIFTSC